MGGSNDPELSPEQRERMAAAIAAELVRLRDAAVAAGVPPEVLAKEFEERRRSLAADSAADSAAEDVEDGAGDAPDDVGIGQ